MVLAAVILSRPDKKPPAPYRRWLSSTAGVFRRSSIRSSFRLPNTDDHSQHQSRHSTKLTATFTLRQSTRLWPRLSPHYGKKIELVIRYDKFWLVMNSLPDRFGTMASGSFFPRLGRRENDLARGVWNFICVRVFINRLSLSIVGINEVESKSRVDKGLCRWRGSNLVSEHAYAIIFRMFSV